MDKTILDDFKLPTSHDFTCGYSMYDNWPSCRLLETFIIFGGDPTPEHDLVASVSYEFVVGCYYQEEIPF